MTRRLPALSALFLAASLAASRGEVSFSPLFGSHSVLQQEVPVPIWGTAAPGETVTVAYGGLSQAAQAGPDGKWQVRLGPFPAGTAGELSATAPSGSAKSTDVAAGEVWLCAGQSNMQLTVKLANDAAREAAAADTPAIREFRAEIAVADAPRGDAVGTWIPCTPQSVPGFSAAAYYFARELRKDRNVPVGLILCAKGGSPIEAWLSPEGLRASGCEKAVRTRYEAAQARWQAQQAAVATPTHVEPGEAAMPQYGPGGYAAPSGLHNGMLRPLAPVAVRGVLWYQGESSIGSPDLYRALFGTFIGECRALWDRPDLPFLFVQLPNIGEKMSYDHTGNGWPLLREAQLQTLSLPHTGMAVTIDVGDPDNRHPKNKQEVGRRLSLAARAAVYGDQVEGSGPLYHSCEAEGNALRVHFDHAAGLKARSGAAPGGFEIAGSDRHYHPAAARIDGEAVVLASPDVPAPVAARYAWRDDPQPLGADLANGADLPASPFRTEDWPTPPIRETPYP